MRYRHTQKAPLHLVLLGAAAALLVGAGVLYADAPPAAVPAAIVFAAVAAVIAVLAFAFRELTVEDGGDHLALRYGPLPLFRARIPYAGITSAEPGRSSLIDGWGIHCIPWRGWTYNLWGYVCVKLVANGKVIRVGTDDVENLTAFLRQCIGKNPA